ncbi:hypothetical protein [Ruegeria profundi]|uniref:Cobalt transporter n=1 Tax=Ruegeria profundi TaxID=1685378 RepID=A0A0X3TBE3_9RHOB|nr:hypothetical protein [Ruegeria profundi]KUJ73137.1 hypothetical protein AVO44_20255 [Ruegeria profundi]
MRFFRLLMILSVFFSIAHTNAMAGAHGLMENELHVSVPDTHSSAHEHCCTDHNDNSPDCHIFAGLLPAPADGEPLPEVSSDISAENGIVPDGVELAGPLDPPRSA